MWIIGNDYLFNDYLQQLLFEPNERINRRKAENVARSRPDTGLVNTDIHNDHDEKFQVISKLQQANHQLYQYAIEAIFNGQSKERGAIENVECIELDE